MNVAVFLVCIILDSIVAISLLRNNLSFKRKLVLIISTLGVGVVLLSLIGLLALWLLTEESTSILFTQMLFSMIMLLGFTILFHFEWVIRKFFGAFDNGQWYVKAFIEMYRGLYLFMLGSALLLLQGIAMFKH